MRGHWEFLHQVGSGSAPIRAIFVGRVTQVGDALDDFRCWVIRRLTGWMPHRSGNGTRTHPPLGEAMAEEVLQNIEIHTDHCPKTVAQYIMTRTLMGLCLAEGRRMGRGFQSGGGSRRASIWRGYGRHRGWRRRRGWRRWKGTGVVGGRRDGGRVRIIRQGIP